MGEMGKFLPQRIFGSSQTPEGPRDLDEQHIRKLITAVDNAIAETNAQMDDPYMLADTAHEALGRIDAVTIEAVDAEFARLDAEIAAVREEWAKVRPAFQRYAARVIERVKTYTADQAELREFVAKRAARLKIPD